MRRMLTDPGEITECSFENISNRSVFYVPNIKLEDLPISFEIIITAQYSHILSFRATILYKSNDGEVQGGGIFTTWEGNTVKLMVNPDSLVYPEDYPELTMEAQYIRGDMTAPPIPDGAHVFIRDIVHLSKQMNEIH